MKHTEFMKELSQAVRQYLEPPFDQYHIGESKWICQIYYGSNARIHYEISRPWTKIGQQLEIGLHFENRNHAENWQLLEGVDQYLLEIRAKLAHDVQAEMWDRGWTKVYELHPDEELTTAYLTQIAQRWAKFILVVQPILEMTQEGH